MPLDIHRCGPWKQPGNSGREGRVEEGGEVSEKAQTSPVAQCGIYR